MILGQSEEYILKLMDDGRLRVSVFGLGRVGIPLAVAWLRAGQTVIGADINMEVVNQINRGVSPILDEPRIPQSIDFFVRKGRLKATTDLIRASENSDVKFVIVPTTNTKRGFNSEALESALRNIGRGLKKGDAVSIECTVPPTTTQGWAKPILEEESCLSAGEEFALAFSPERVYEGRVLEDIEERYPKVVGGIDRKSTKLFSILYSRVAKKGVISMSNATAAELSKVFEGVYRDVNIALANELSKLCHSLDIDFEEVRTASNSQPFSHIHKPGPGVGGACISSYPYFIIEKAEELGLKLDLTKLARVVNEEMPSYLLSLAQLAMNEIGRGLSNTRTAILGLSFRGDVADSRNSPTYEIVDLLLGEDVKVVVHDPFIEHNGRLASEGVRLVKSLEDALSDVSLMIIATDHTEYSKIDLNKIVRFMDIPAAIVDGRNTIKNRSVPEGLYLTGIGLKAMNSLSKK